MGCRAFVLSTEPSRWMERDWNACDVVRELGRVGCVWDGYRHDITYRYMSYELLVGWMDGSVYHRCPSHRESRERYAGTPYCEAEAEMIAV